MWFEHVVAPVLVALTYAVIGWFANIGLRWWVRNYRAEWILSKEMGLWYLERRGRHGSQAFNVECIVSNADGSNSGARQHPFQYDPKYGQREIVQGLTEDGMLTLWWHDSPHRVAEFALTGGSGPYTLRKAKRRRR